MATEIKIKNFKSLVDVDITLKPITLLFGPNNNGKSSLINSLFFLSENMTTIHKTRFKLGKENLSSFKEVVSFNDEEKEVVFEIATTVDIEKFVSSRKSGVEKLRENSGSEDGETEDVYNFEKSILKRLEGKRVEAHTVFAEKTDKENPARKLKRIELFLESEKIININFDKIHFCEKDDTSLILDIHADKGFVDLFFDDNNEINEILKDIFKNFFEATSNGEKEKVSFSNAIRLPNLYSKKNFLEFFKREKKEELVEEFTDNIFNKFTEIVFLFSHLMTSQWGIGLPTFTEHLGPIRERPKHKYLINGDVDYSRDFYFTQFLEEETEEDGVNTAKEVEKILPFFFEDTSILVKKNEDIGRLFIRQSEATFNLAEASSGFLQLLPILIKQPKVIEQPELHLHPKLQARFADLFVHWYVEEKKEVIVETHSEHILRRLQVLVAKGEVSRDDVAIYYFDKKDGETKIIEMKMEANGLFTNDWPEGFFDDKANLAFELMDAIKNRN